MPSATAWRAPQGKLSQPNHPNFAASARPGVFFRARISAFCFFRFPALAFQPTPRGPGGGGWIRTNVGARPTDLQSAPFSRSGTPPVRGTANYLWRTEGCQTKPGFLTGGRGLFANGPRARGGRIPARAQAEMEAAVWLAGCLSETPGFAVGRRGDQHYPRRPPGPMMCRKRSSRTLRRRVPPSRESACSA
jgi:hypothetical protein